MLSRNNNKDISKIGKYSKIKVVLIWPYSGLDISYQTPEYMDQVRVIQFGSRVVVWDAKGAGTNSFGQRIAEKKLAWMRS